MAFTLVHHLDAVLGQGDNDLIEYRPAHVAVPALRGNGDCGVDLNAADRSLRAASIIRPIGKHHLA